MMDLINLECDEDFDIRCGEVYLSVEGNFHIHCTFCERKYDAFQEFYSHIKLKHRPPNRALSKLCEYDTFMVILDDDSCSNSDFMDDIQDLEEYFAGDFDQRMSPSFDIKTKLKGSAESSTPKDTSYEIIRHTPINEDMRHSPDARSKNEYELKNSISEGVPSSENKPNLLNLKTKKEINFNCPHCKYAGKDKANFKAHVKRHFSINKNKKCSMCPMSFHSSCELKRHLLTHTGEKPFLCQECGKAYSNKHKLKAHFKRHLNQRDVPCPLCDKTFFSKQALEEHMAVHKNERRFRCSICQASFKLRKGLRTHSKIHENQLQYKCTLCPARFNQNPGLRAHMRSKHGPS